MKAQILKTACDGMFVQVKLEDQTFRLVYFTELYKYELSKKDEKVLEGVTRGRS